MQTLEALWYGQLCPIGRTDYCDSQYRQLFGKYGQAEKAFLQTLSESQLAQLEQLKQLEDALQRSTEYSAFATGFRLAVQLMAESMR